MGAHFELCEKKFNPICRIIRIETDKSSRARNFVKYLPFSKTLNFQRWSCTARVCVSLLIAANQSKFIMDIGTFSPIENAMQ